MNWSFKLNRRWFQYSLRTMLVFVLLVSVGMSWLAVKLQRASRQKAAVEAILAEGGSVKYDYEIAQPGKPAANEPPGPAWLRTLLGRDFFADVTFVHITIGPDPMGKCLEDLPQLEYVWLSGGRARDEALTHLRGLSRLVRLDLRSSGVTDAGLENLEGLKQIKFLHLDTTRIDGHGLRHLKNLRGLRELTLRNTDVDDAGLAHLAGLTQLERLELEETRITDAGLVHVSGLTELRTLNIDAKGITGSGIVHLKRMTHLESLRAPIGDISLETVRILLNLLRDPGTEPMVCVQIAMLLRWESEYDEEFRCCLKSLPDGEAKTILADSLPREYPPEDYE